MKNLLFIVLAFTTTICIANDKKTSAQFSTNDLVNQKWHIQSQSFASHDQSGTDVDTVRGNELDYINFSDNGYAYCLFNGVHDTLEYKLIGTDSISFGDTPFLITFNNDQVEFYQNEEEKNGDYNRVRYSLISERKYSMKTISKK